MAAASLVALCVGLTTSFTSLTIVALPAFLVGAAMADRRERRGTESRRERRGRRGLAAALAFWTLFLAVATSAEIPLAEAERAATAGDVDAAVALLDQAEGRRPWDVDVSIIGAEMLAAAADRGIPGAAEAAITRAEAVLERAPDSVEAAMALAVAQMALGAAGDGQALTAAHATLATLAERLPDDPAVLHRFGGVLIYEGRLTEAEGYLAHAASVDPDNRDILLTLEYVYEQLGDQAALDEVRARLEALSVVEDPLM
jgi:tetratricopeptide (TPR) repeat protein